VAGAWKIYGDPAYKNISYATEQMAKDYIATQIATYPDKYYHKGGEVTKLGPKEVPIIAEEGELIVPAGYSTANFDSIMGKHIDRLIKAMDQRFNFTIQKMFAPENITVTKDTDWKKVSRKMTNDLLLATGGVR
jgi:hypothetical protein